MKQAARADSVGMAPIAQTARKLAPSVPFAKDSVGNPTIRSLVIIGRRVVFIRVAPFTSSRKKTTHPRTILNRQFDVRSRCLLQRYSEQQGIEILTGVNATSPIRDDLDRVRAVRLSNGNELEADLFLACVDVRPDVSLAEAAGIATRNGLLVDDY